MMDQKQLSVKKQYCDNKKWIFPQVPKFAKLCCSVMCNYITDTAVYLGLHLYMYVQWNHSAFSVIVTDLAVESLLWDEVAVLLIFPFLSAVSIQDAPVGLHLRPKHSRDLPVQLNTFDQHLKIFVLDLHVFVMPLKQYLEQKRTHH